MARINVRSWLRAAVLGLVLVTAAAQAAPAPEVLVKQTTEQVLSELKAQQAEVKANPDLAVELVREIVLPHFDFELMSRLVLARNWRTATPEQQQRFVEGFRDLLIRTYATSLAEYSGQKVEFLPVQGGKDNRVLVRSEIIQPAGPKIPVDYHLHETPDGWKVFDVAIDGVSLVQNYRGSFASEVQQRGLDGLITRLVEHRGRKGGS